MILNSGVRRGRYSDFNIASPTHATKMISIIMRNVKFFPVMYGKSREEETYSGRIGISQSPIFTIHNDAFSNEDISAWYYRPRAKSNKNAEEAGTSSGDEKVFENSEIMHVQ